MDSVSLIPAYDPPMWATLGRVLAALGLMLFLCITLISAQGNSDKAKGTAVLAGLATVVCAICTAMAHFAVEQEVDIQTAETRLGVTIEPKPSGMTVTEPDGTVHTDCEFTPATTWNRNEFDTQPYELTCHGHQITKQN